MHVLLDLQALQTPNSRHRGIGRYSLSLVKAIASRSDARFSAIFSSAFPDEYEEAVRWLDGTIPRHEMHLFDVPGRTAAIDGTNAWRARQAASLLALKVGTIAADFVHVASLFEGLTDDAVTTVADSGRGWSTTIYDLIPWYQRDRYLQNDDTRRWYMAKLEQARRAEVLFAISESARREAMETLSRGPESVVNIRGDVDPMFTKRAVAPSRREALLRPLAVDRDFVLYTGGIDYRKNVEGLIEAYADLPGSIRKTHQLVIVCKVTEADRVRLGTLARQSGLAPSELVLSGFVCDDDLADLYRSCRLFVFPSLHEGFGMPILEAMRCGAPVIASDNSSMPEIVGLESALFDPRSKPSMTQKLAQALTDEGMLDRLRRNSDERQELFSWEATADRVLATFEALHERRASRRSPARISVPPRRPSLAMVSPLPPDQSGIADYASELIPALAAYYDITLVTDHPTIDQPWLDGVYPICSTHQFERLGHAFDRIVYQLGNSAFHLYTLQSIRDRPGTVVLHDFFLSNLFDYKDRHDNAPGILRRALFDSHGYPPLLELDAEPGDTAGASANREAVLRRYPCSAFAFEQSYGTIVHSSFAVGEARLRYGTAGDHLIRRIAHLRAIPPRRPRSAAREALAIAHDAVVVCSFGLIGPTKLNEETIEAWASSGLADDARHSLVFVGPVSDGAYQARLLDLVTSLKVANSVRFEGFVDDDRYRFFLEAADCAIQLRRDSRGETSGAVLHCLANGLPVIVNEHGTLNELPKDAVKAIPERFTVNELSKALRDLVRDPDERARRIAQGVAYVRDNCDVRTIAVEYHEAIERFYASHPNRRLDQYLETLLRTPGGYPEAADVENVAAIAEATLVAPRRARCLVDITSGVDGFERLREVLAVEQSRYRVEAVTWRDGRFWFARTEAFASLRLAPVAVDDDLVDVRGGDLMLLFDVRLDHVRSIRSWLVRQRGDGLHVYVERWSEHLRGADVDRSRWLAEIAPLVDGFLTRKADGPTSMAARYDEEADDLVVADLLARPARPTDSTDCDDGKRASPRTDRRVGATNRSVAANIRSVEMSTSRVA